MLLWKRWPRVTLHYFWTQTGMNMTFDYFMLFNFINIVVHIYWKHVCVSYDLWWCRLYYYKDYINLSYWTLVFIFFLIFQQVWFLNDIHSVKTSLSPLKINILKHARGAPERIFIAFLMVWCIAHHRSSNPLRDIVRNI